MTVYAVFIHEHTRDRAELDRYAELAPLARREDMRLLVRYGAQKSLEGAPPEGLVIIAFPDMHAAQSWYDSDAYERARAHRLKGGDYRVILVEGI